MCRIEAEKSKAGPKKTRVTGRDKNIGKTGGVGNKTFATKVLFHVAFGTKVWLAVGGKSGLRHAWVDAGNRAERHSGSMG